MSKNVVVIGGGVAGMSAAQELAERGFKVSVYEKQKKYVGGKARSVDVEYDGKHEIKPGNKPLPGEHGFRFFPGFYRHVTDTMKRIPFPGNPNGVADNLVPTDRVMMARFDQPPLINIVNFPKSLEDLIVLIKAMIHSGTGLTHEDGEFFANKLWQLMTSAFERRKAVYERIGWWQFVEADSRSRAYQKYFAEGLTRTLVAAQPHDMSTETGGNILLQLLFLMGKSKAHADQVLNRPTNDAWLDPWFDYLTKTLNVAYHKDAQVVKVDLENGQVAGVWYVDKDGSLLKVKGDYYVFAVPVEVMAELVTPEMISIDTTLAYIKNLANDTSWMNGIQFYLNTEVNLTHGHVIFIDSPWAITAISQIPFWKDFDISKYGNGKVKSIISVDVSDWDTPGLLDWEVETDNGIEKRKVKAKDCTSKEQIMKEVWYQMKISLMKDGKSLISDEMIEDWYIDGSIYFNIVNKEKGFAEDDEKVKSFIYEKETGKKPKIEDDGELAVKVKPETSTITDEALLDVKKKLKNAEPLLVNKVNSWSLRPEAYTGISNMFLASDYVRTNTNLATMEGANEAARRAVNAIIQQSGVKAPFCKIWPLHEPNILWVLRTLDKYRFKKGLPWKKHVPLVFRILHSLNVKYRKLLG
jgi:uncharacterized protein with NAD-binding domain and iron-sulfur cluster